MLRNEITVVLEKRAVTSPDSSKVGNKQRWVAFIVHWVAGLLRQSTEWSQHFIYQE